MRSKEELLAYGKLYYKTHREEIKIKAKRYRQTNKDEIRRKRQDFRRTHKEELNEYLRIYRRTHPSCKIIAHRRIRQQRIMALEILAIHHNTTADHCWICGIKEHRGLPFNLFAESHHLLGHDDKREGGSTLFYRIINSRIPKEELDNLQLICPTCHTLAHKDWSE